MKQSLHLNLNQHIMLTPQLQQAIRLLQLSTFDLRQEIQLHPITHRNRDLILMSHLLKTRRTRMMNFLIFSGQIYTQILFKTRHLMRIIISKKTYIVPPSACKIIYVGN